MNFDGLLPRGKRHDYFTSCLPWPQKGPAVELPLGTSATVAIDAAQAFPAAATGDPKFQFGATNSTLRSASSAGGSPLDVTGVVTTSTIAGWNDPNLETDIGGATGIADLSTAVGATINQLRQSVAVQRLYEKDARGGTRYKEILLSHFGRTVKDSRLQRPEYLGGGTTQIHINQQPNTGPPVGQYGSQMTAWATAVGGGNLGFSRSFDEFGLIMGIVSARADLNYQQGINKMHSRRTRWEYYWPELANLGEQSVLNREIYSQGTADDDAVFGYQERFAEMRYKPSTISGQMRSSAGQSLDVWHLAQDFIAKPVLGHAFIVEDPPVDRIVTIEQSEGQPSLTGDFYFSYKCVRPMPQFGVPGLTRL